MGNLELLYDKKITDILKLNCFSSVEIDVCKYVSKNICYSELNNINFGKSISLDELLNRSIDEISIFGDDIKEMVVSIISKVPVNMISDDDLDYSSYISYSTIDGDIISKIGKRLEYVIPKNLYDLSVYQFSHEHFHMLKETNYNEYVNAFVFGEVIPILYELITFDTYDEIKGGLLKIRLSYLFFNKNDFLMLDNQRNICSSFADDNVLSLYDWTRTKYGSYLNSFYYAVILYNMYKVNPKEILNLVSMVLKHKMTTIEMLEKLNIYGDIKGAIFETELDKIKRLIR